jgi:hypothetical protein
MLVTILAWSLGIIIAFIYLLCAVMFGSENATYHALLGFKFSNMWTWYIAIFLVAALVILLLLLVARSKWSRGYRVACLFGILFSNVPILLTVCSVYQSNLA